MCHKVSYVFIFILTVLCSQVKGQETFEKMIDMGLPCGGNSVVQLADGNYIIGGYWLPAGAGPSAPLLLKFNESGTVVWSKYLSKGDFGTVNSVTSSENGGVYIGGFSSIGGIGGSGAVFVMKIDSFGNSSWVRTLPDASTVNLLKSKNGFIAAGSRANFSGCYISEIDSTGKELWKMNSSGDSVASFADFVSSVIAFTDTTFLVTGTTSQGRIDVEEINYSGNLKWYREILDSTLSLVSTSSFKTIDGGFAISGYTQDKHNNRNAFLSRHDSKGEFEWAREIDIFFQATSELISESSTGDFLMACNLQSSDAFMQDSAEIILIANDGSFKSARIIPDSVVFNAMLRSGDSGFILVGNGMRLLKLDDSGRGCRIFHDVLATDRPLGMVVTKVLTYDAAIDTLTVPSIKIVADLPYKETGLCNISSVALPIDEENPILIYPNPVRSNELLTISIDASLNIGAYTILISDFLGNTIKRQRLNIFDRQQDIQFDLHECEPGVYWIRIQNENKVVASAKFIRQ